MAAADSLQRHDLYRRYPRHQSRPQRPLSFPSRAIPGRDFPVRDFPGGNALETSHTSTRKVAMPALTYDFHMRQLEEFIEEYKALQKQVRASGQYPKDVQISFLHHLTVPISVTITQLLLYLFVSLLVPSWITRQTSFMYCPISPKSVTTDK